ncbi:MAG: phage terminase large subunit [Synergistaceae bacterium]|jgi:predicted phage terminase large subunit-like protein|nr:phage terminase large subunit [Synergistaceae bacterium]
MEQINARLREIREDRANRLREQAKNSYRAYVEYVHRGRWKGARHLDLLCKKLEEVERGELSRLIVTMPPRHGKSMTVTESFPSWFIGRSPDRRVIEVSYGDRLAKKFGRANRRKIEEFGKELFGVEVDRGNRSVTNWGLLNAPGGMISAGIDGTITGEGADLLVIDDPIKNRKEAESEIYRESIWAEWQDTLLSRLHPGASVIAIMTRWHEDDLVGRFLKEDCEQEWMLINLPAVAEEENKDILERNPGELLWPEHGFDEKWAKRKKRESGSRTWEALYQGRPTIAEGNLFKKRHFRKFRRQNEVFELLTDNGVRYVEKSTCQTFQTCDVAGSTKSSADYFVVGTFALTPQNELLILDVFRTRIEGPDQPGHMRRLFQEWRPLLQGVESKNMGLTLFQQLKRDGLPIIELKADIDKFSRAIPAAARYESGSVYHLENAPWLGDLEKELTSFPNGAHDDQVDVVAYAILVQLWGYLSRGTKPMDRAYVLG